MIEGLPKLDCGGCTLCCLGDTITLQPGEPHKAWKTDRSAGGAYTLRKGADGECVYLRPNGCATYKRQPAMCFVFDCRQYAAWIDTMTPAERATREANPLIAVKLAEGRRRLALLFETERKT